MKQKSESGQALVLILLSLSVVLTLVLFILSRSVTDIAVSSTQEQSVRAFSAAEAGIERALVTGANYTNYPIGDATYTATVSKFAEGLTEFVYPSLLSSGDSATVWFIAHEDNGDLTTTGAFTGSGMKICWGSGILDASSPAIEVSIFYETIPGTLSTIKIAREAFDPFNSTGVRPVPNSFAPAPVIGACSIGGKSFAFQKTITFPPTVNLSGLLFAKIRMLYNTSPQGIGISVIEGTLPSQGQQIDSSGQVAGGSNRRIIVHQSWAESPFASNSIITPVGITK